MRRFVSIVSLAVVLGLTVITAAQAQTCDQINGCPAAPPPPFQCTTANSVVVAAIPQGGVFPVPDTCANGADCLRWSYSFTQLASQTISVSAITVDSDAVIFKASTGVPPNDTTGGMKIYANGSTDSSIGGLGGLAFDFRTVKFSSGSPVVGNIWTGTNVGIGTVTALAKVGNSGPTTCAIAGPDNIIGTSVGKAPLNTTQIDSFEGCDIQIAVDAKGCPTAVVASPAPGSPSTLTCTVSQTTFNLTPGAGGGGGSNQPFSGGVCGNRFVTGNNTCVWYCPTSFGSCFQVCK